MDEEPWLRATKPQPLLSYLRSTHRLSPRKERLFASAACRRVSTLLVHEASRSALLNAERYAEGLLEPAERSVFFQRAEEVWVCLGDSYNSTILDPENEYDAAIITAGAHRLAIAAAAGSAACAIAEGETNAGVDYAPDWAVEAAGWMTVPDGVEYADKEAEAAERAAQTDLLRDIFGPLPFREVQFNPSWRSPTVLALATAAYEERDLPSGHLDNTRLAMLADCLEESDCDNQEVLAHLRQQGAVHVRGCFVLDLILNREWGADHDRGRVE